MTETKKRNLFFQEMLSKGAAEHEIRPLLFRMLWSMGINVPPPLYATRIQLFFTVGVPGGTIWGAFMWLTIWRHSSDSLLAMTAVSACFAILTTFGTRFLLNRTRKKLGIEGDWKSYDPVKSEASSPSTPS